MDKFQILCLEKHSKARLGIIKTAHGKIMTPAFVPVGTQASVKALSNEDLKQIGTQVFFVNTYHMYLRPGVEKIKGLGGLHKFIGWNKPLMTDSAGFQIFSLGKGKKHHLEIENSEAEPSLVKIGEEGVLFRSHLDGGEHLFTPEVSIDAQMKLGADIMIAFDECVFYPADRVYVESAMKRTHRWALRCFERSSKLRKNEQALYGVVQGGVYEDLRKESAKYISSLPFEGIAIGGVSVGESKKEMINVLDWVVPCLPGEKPRHLLGVGEIDDIFELVERGVDSFDCVMPSRLGRMGHALTEFRVPLQGKQSSEFRVAKWTIDIDKTEFSQDKGPIDEKCSCFVCKNYSRAYLNHLFRAKELLAYRLLTYHNLYFVEKLMEAVRASIKDSSFLDLKKEWLGEK